MAYKFLNVKYLFDETSLDETPPGSDDQCCTQCETFKIDDTIRHTIIELYDEIVDD
jgi:hypothetical protein